MLSLSLYVEPSVQTTALSQSLPLISIEEHSLSSVVSAALIVLGLGIYFKKRKHQA
jgi:hypothetical protein